MDTQKPGDTDNQIPGDLGTRTLGTWDPEPWGHEQSDPGGLGNQIPGNMDTQIPGDLGTRCLAALAPSLSPHPALGTPGVTPAHLGSAPRGYRAVFAAWASSFEGMKGQGLQGELPGKTLKSPSAPHICKQLS